MAKWLIQGTDKTEEGTEKGWQRLNATRNRETEFKAKPIIFVDDRGTTHADVDNPMDARKAGLLVKGKEKEVQGRSSARFSFKFLRLPSSLL